MKIDPPVNTNVLSVPMTEGVQSPRLPLSEFKKCLGSMINLVKILSWKQVSLRLKEGTEIQAVAHQIVQSLQISDAQEQERFLEDTWAVYGPERFKKAMRARSWIDWKGCIVTPAIACCLLRSSRWFLKLGVLVPPQHWGDRVSAEASSEIFGEKFPSGTGAAEETFLKRSLTIKSYAPLHVICLNQDLLLKDILMHSFFNQNIPTLADDLACRSLCAYLDKRHKTSGVFKNKWTVFVEHEKLESSTPAVSKKTVKSL